MFSENAWNKEETSDPSAPTPFYSDLPPPSVRHGYDPRAMGAAI